MGRVPLGYLKVPDDLAIEFKSAVSVGNRDIWFTDIAKVESSDQDFIRALEQVNLGPAPSAGYTRNLTSGYIELRLRQQRIHPSSLPVEIPGSIEIRSEITIQPSASIVSATAQPYSPSPGGANSSPYLVERGELVRVSVKTGSAEVVAVGEARTNGRLGDLVEVKNVDTGKRFYGRVVSAGVVEVDLSG
jgi:hypothetical protein